MTDFHFPLDDWQVLMVRHDGTTSFRVRGHVRPMVAVTNPELFWGGNYIPETDDDGYILPDDNMDCGKDLVKRAYAISAVPAMIRALQIAIPCLRGVPKQEAEKALMVARGELSEDQNLTAFPQPSLMTRATLKGLVADSNLSSLARDAGVSYHALRRMMTDMKYDPPYSLIRDLTRYFETENKA